MLEPQSGVQGPGKLGTLGAESRAPEGTDTNKNEPVCKKAHEIYACTSALRVAGKIAGMKASFLLDTGATVTLLSEEYWNKIQRAASTTVKQWKGPGLVGANGSPLAVQGCAVVQLEVGSSLFQQEVVVSSCLSVDGILGMDFLTANQCTIDVGEGKLHIASRGTVVHLHTAVRQSTERSPMLYVEKSTVIPAWSEMEIMGTTKEIALEEGIWMIERAVLSSGLITARAVVKSQSNGGVPLRVMNLSQQPTNLYQGTRLGELVKVEESMIAGVESNDRRKKEPHTVSAHKLEFLQQMVNDVGADLSDKDKEVLLELLLEYADIFAVSDEELSHTERLKHSIYTGDSAPVRQPVRRVPPHRRQEVHDLLQDMLKRKIIQPSSSPWASPIVLVRKSDGSTRFCVDFRKLNDITRKDTYPLPHIEDTLATLAGSKIFSTLDLLSGYWQVGMANEDQEKTAFGTTEGLFEFRVMPFGLCNAPATFQRLMDLVLAGLLWSHCLVYVDDVIVLGKDFSDHISNLNAVFQRLREANLRLKPSKCSFLQRKVCYLGHIVSSEGISTDPAKTDKVRNWPCPTNVKEVQQFLGFSNYYRKFIKNFATIAKPLYQITERKGTFKWTAACQEAFDTLRIQLSTAPMLAYPDYTRPFILDTDASDVGMGGVLSQVGEDGYERVIAFGSKLLSKAERSYCVTRKELLAVVTFTQHFRQYLFGREFTVRTDHGSLTWLKNFKHPEGQLARWLEKLAEFHFNIVHRGGRKHCNADSLSRLPCRQCGRVPDEDDSSIVNLISVPTDVERLHKDQREDPALGPVITGVTYTTGAKLVCHVLQGKHLYQKEEQPYAQLRLDIPCS